MTEAEWLTATDPTLMLEFLENKVSDRKLRLFSAGCCHRVWHLVGDVQLLAALIDLEQFADGKVKDKRRAQATKIAIEVAQRKANTPESSVGWELWKMATKTISRVQLKLGESAAASLGWVEEVQAKRQFHSVKMQERSQQTHLVRDIFGNPFYPVAIDTSLLTSTAVAIAQGIYDDRAFDRLPILADALQDSGCENADILNHCRSEGPHVRGCWVVDLVLGKQ